MTRRTRRHAVEAATNRPPAPGSKDRRPGLGVVSKSALDRRQAPNSSTKAADARSGAAFTRTATQTLEAIHSSRHAP